MAVVCKYCGDEHIVRNGVVRTYKRRPDHVGVRYLCRECGKTFMVRVMEAQDAAYTKADRAFSSGADGGRPTRIDWRHAA
jgi:transposase-like protein